MIVGLFAQTTKETTTMAEGRRMTAAREAVEQLLECEHADVLRESVAWMVAELMEAEVAAQIGAELGERAPEQRTAQRNGYRPRRWDTRVGEIELQIPKLRQGSYFPSILEPRKRSEQALVAVVQEAYINGVCTRKVDRLVEQMGLRGMSKDQVSRLCRGLDEQVAAFRERPLEGAYPYLWLDAKVERVREPGGVRQKCLVLAYAVHESGRREVLGLDVGECETEAFWREFLRSRRARGLTGVRLCISDAHEGLKNAIAQVLDARRLVRGHARCNALVDVGLLDPRADRLHAVAQLPGHAPNRPVRHPRLRPQRADHPHRRLLLLRRIPTRRRLASTLLLGHELRP